MTTCMVHPLASREAGLLARILALYSFNTFPIQSTLNVIVEEAHIVEVHFTLTVPDRVSGKWINVSTDRTIDSRQFLGMEGAQVRSRLDALMRAFILDMITHEVDEHLQFDGMQVRDPHKDDARLREEARARQGVGT